MSSRESLWVRKPAEAPDALSTTPIELSGDSAEELMRIARFGLIVCHELRTPLTSIITSLGSLKEVLQADERTVEGKLLRNALRSALSLKARTEDLQDIANIRAGITTLQKSPVDVAQVIHSAVGSLEMQAGFAGVKVRTEIEEGLPTVSADAVRLEKVVRNLVQNALDYAASGLTVDVRAKCRDGRMIIEVQDYGPGLDPETRMKIFSPDYQQDIRPGEVAGMGIGLELCKIIVEHHRGRIVVVSGVGKGTLLSVEIPLSAPFPGNESQRFRPR